MGGVDGLPAPRHPRRRLGAVRRVVRRRRRRSPRLLTDEGAGLLVHCHMGINRGPSMALAILLDRAGLSDASMPSERHGRSRRR